jgi:hypothetical protein
MFKHTSLKRLVYEQELLENNLLGPKHLLLLLFERKKYHI